MHKNHSHLLHVQSVPNNHRPKLDYLIQKQSKADIFVPFSNERDKLNRLIPILQKSKSQANSYPVSKTYKSDYYTSYKSNQMEINQKLLKQGKKCTHPSILFDFIQDVTVPEVTKFEPFVSIVVPIPQRMQTKQVKEEDINAAKLIFRTNPNFSFSKTVQKTVIEQTIEEGKKHDYDYIDFNHAKDFVLKKNTYIPNYSKATHSRMRVNKTKCDNHEYLMKLLSSGEDSTPCCFLISAAIVIYN